MERYIRHPADIPIEVVSRARLHDAPTSIDPPHSLNFSIKGLAFHCAHPYAPGEIVGIKIALVRPIFAVDARVVWCHSQTARFELGVAFLSEDDAFLARMVEQICHIEDYKQEMQRSQGRELSAEQAAQEWIDKHAAQFPGAAGLQ